ncbi:hypothetical protein DERP_007701 [Dermatophagoides pteronyssinus]|uniref:Uncharacterized protein n=1 Tax=Dermatophagoides pteronyssinus TaxID=6956 RepID=A0ABQ8JKX0_DERPT|nr:hypothetical protein DERP_007701 [Dermatophagoides pteronyssinus]
MKKVRDINIKNTIANWIITRNYSLDRYAVQSCVNCIDPGQNLRQSVHHHYRSRHGEQNDYDDSFGCGEC